ncbi:DUF3574 domain-containing protein [Pseudomonas aeruginosa]|uniref:DUF3574 domain-containing protein n=1 Tax=Pseudomonas aeruginosa TaxID=287 RepID=UPI0032E36C60
MNECWLRTELYIAVEELKDNGRGISNADWMSFLHHQVAPRFPDGFSVFDAYGQWLGKNATEPSRLRSKVLVILHQDTPDERGKIESIRLTWKRMTGIESVLRVSQVAEVSF